MDAKNLALTLRLKVYQKKSKFARLEIDQKTTIRQNSIVSKALLRLERNLLERNLIGEWVLW